MNTPTRVAGFLVALGAVFGIALGVGQAVGPSTDKASRHHRGSLTQRRTSQEDS